MAAGMLRPACIPKNGTMHRHTVFLRRAAVSNTQRARRGVRNPMTRRDPHAAGSPLRILRFPANDPQRFSPHQPVEKTVRRAAPPVGSAPCPRPPLRDLQGLPQNQPAAVCQDAMRAGTTVKQRQLRAMPHHGGLWAMPHSLTMRRRRRKGAACRVSPAPTKADSPFFASTGTGASRPGSRAAMRRALKKKRGRPAVSSLFSLHAAQASQPCGAFPTASCPSSCGGVPAAGPCRPAGCPS